MFAHFTIYKMKTQSTKKVTKYSIENNAFSFLMEFQNASENVFHGFGNLAVWKSFGNIIKVICTNSDVYATSVKG